jgi:hypothetical protein
MHPFDQVGRLDARVLSLDDMTAGDGCKDDKRPRGANSSKRFRLPACLLALDILPIELYLLAEIVADGISRYTLFLSLPGDDDREERFFKHLLGALHQCSPPSAAGLSPVCGEL